MYSVIMMDCKAKENAMLYCGNDLKQAKRVLKESVKNESFSDYIDNDELDIRIVEGRGELVVDEEVSKVWDIFEYEVSLV